ncbi:taste receptor type 2 member 8-like [Ascaphus truei]|uniref:taste receptor type 2 member 8-like n=1 Tax=Ascaphus truei TaxID=8439 RepID=UPI003F592E8B
MMNSQVKTHRTTTNLIPTDKFQSQFQIASLRRILVTLIVGFLIGMIECVAGIILNFYIMAVNFFDWKMGHKLSPCDQILVIMALNNVFLQCGLNVNESLAVMCPELLFSREVYLTTSILLMFELYISFWLTACLCIYYCLRIVTFNHNLFIHLKFRISALVPKLILVSGLGSFAISIPCIWEVHVGPLLGSGNVTGSSFVNNMSFHLSLPYKAIIITLGCCLPFLLTLFSIALTLTSLWTHARRMKQNASGSSPPPRIDAHLRAARIMLWSMLFVFFILIYPTAQSSIVILGNTKLRTTCLRTLHCTGRI